MQDHGASDVPSDPGVLAARHDVEIARAELEHRLDDVGHVGRRAWMRLGQRSRPILIGGAVVVGTLLLIRAFRPASPARRRLESRPARGPSVLGVAVQAALGVALQTVVTELTRHAALRLVSLAISPRGFQSKA